MIALFQKNLIVLAQSYAENDRCDILEAMNPLLSLTPLSSNVEHASQPLAKSHQPILPTHCMLKDPIVNLVSYIPVVFVLALNTSASIGMYSGAEILFASSKKLESVSDAPKKIYRKTYYGAESIR